jgi:hypothetical protein
VAGDPAAAASAFPGATVAGAHEVDVPPMTVEALNAALAGALATGVRVVALGPRESTLEAEFHAAVGGRERAS